jgi:hypothetical protein
VYTDEERRIGSSITGTGNPMPNLPIATRRKLLNVYSRNVKGRLQRVSFRVSASCFKKVMFDELKEEFLTELRNTLRGDNGRARRTLQSTVNFPPSSVC